MIPCNIGTGNQIWEKAWNMFIGGGGWGCQNNLNVKTLQVNQIRQRLAGIKVEDLYCIARQDWRFGNLKHRYMAKRKQNIQTREQPSNSVNNDTLTKIIPHWKMENVNGEYRRNSGYQKAVSLLQITELQKAPWKWSSKN